MLIRAVELDDAPAISGVRIDTWREILARPGEDARGNPGPWRWTR